MVTEGTAVQASGPSAVTRELVNGINRPVEQGPFPGRADLEASKHGKSDEDSVGRDQFNDLQSLHGDTVRHPLPQPRLWSFMHSRVRDRLQPTTDHPVAGRRLGGAQSQSCCSSPPSEICGDVNASCGCGT